MDFITKPFDDEMLLTAVRSAVAKRRQGGPDRGPAPSDPEPEVPRTRAPE